MGKRSFPELIWLAPCERSLGSVIIFVVHGFVHLQMYFPRLHFECCVFIRRVLSSVLSPLVVSSSIPSPSVNVSLSPSVVSIPIVSPSLSLLSFPSFSLSSLSLSSSILLIIVLSPVASLSSPYNWSVIGRLHNTRHWLTVLLCIVGLGVFLFFRQSLL